MLYKKGLLISLISRYFNICSSNVFFHSEMEKFKRTFSLNGYPATLVDSCIKSFIDKMYNSRDIVHTCSKKVIYFCLPFTGHHGLHIRSQLQKFLSSSYPLISLRVVFRPSFRLSNFFPFKDKIPCELRSHVVYLYKCQCCGALYVGQTRRHIYTRVSLNTWVFHLWLERKVLFQPCQAYSLQPSPSRSGWSKREKKRGCSTRLGPRCDVTAKGASERLEISIFLIRRKIYI
jgi:hypothetical protein